MFEHNRVLKKNTNKSLVKHNLEKNNNFNLKDSKM